MDYYKSVKNFFDAPNTSVPQELEYGTVNSFNSINIPSNHYLLPSNVLNRQGIPGPGIFGTKTNNEISQTIQPMPVMAQQGARASHFIDNSFLNSNYFPKGTSSINQGEYANIDLQTERPVENQNFTQQIVKTNDNNEVISIENSNKFENYYIKLASDTLHVKPDKLMFLYFSDDNINHLRNMVVKKVKEITAESGVGGDNQGVTIQTPNMDDFFYYMVNIYKNYRIYNGSICFVNLKNDATLKSDISKLNTDVLQEYVSKLISQINMYIYYYRDASQLPEQLSQPVYTSSRSKNKVLEYNSGFSSGNSNGMARYNEVGNI